MIGDISNGIRFYGEGTIKQAKAGDSMIHYANTIPVLIFIINFTYQN